MLRLRFGKMLGGSRLLLGIFDQKTHKTLGVGLEWLGRVFRLEEVLGLENKLGLDNII